MKSNPLLHPFDAVPFSKINDDHFKPAFIEAIKQAREEIDSITQNQAIPTFNNTLVALELSGNQLSRIFPVLFSTSTVQRLMTVFSKSLRMYPLCFRLLTMILPLIKLCLNVLLRFMISGKH